MWRWSLLRSFWKSSLLTICWNSHGYQVLANLFPCSYETEFIQWKTPAVALNSTFRFIVDILSLTTATSILLLTRYILVNLKYRRVWDILLEKNITVTLITKLFDKYDHFQINFSTVNFSYLYSNTPSSPVYGVFVSQLIQYPRACYTYGTIYKTRQSTNKQLTKQDHGQSWLKSSFRNFYHGRYNDLVCKKKIFH